MSSTWHHSEADGEEPAGAEGLVPAETTGLEVAVIGMAGRFPGACDLERLWRNLCNAVESISFFSRDELVASGITEAELDEPGYVPARAWLEDTDLFDAAFFEYSPREATILDPQQRLFLESAWQALEHAGYDPGNTGGRVGVFAGTSMSSYLLTNLLPNAHLAARVGGYQVLLANDKDFLTTRTSYKLNLKGPSVTVQTACSTSLVAVHLACQSLISGDCEMALAGGVSVSFPRRRGHLHAEGAIFSPDGHCRPYDHRAQGTVNGDGVGVVVLKRLEDAVADRDPIRAVIRGSAINNDGSGKVGYTAPSVEGQIEVINAAQVMAEVEAESIGYVEGHGTATPLGDPIELTALTEAFRATTEKRAFCALGSIKSNFGHVDAAAGIAGLIKTVLILEHGAIPPSLHFERPNPEIDLESSPFYVSDELRPWPPGGEPRRAAVSSFGIGGTNAHAVLEEAPPASEPGPSRQLQLLVLSARTETAVDASSARLADALRGCGERHLADVAYTLTVGRHPFEHRRALLCRSSEEAVATLVDRDSRNLLAGRAGGGARPVYFLFPGQGTQYVNMALELYRSEELFRRELEHCAEILRPHLGIDPLEVLFPPPSQGATAADRLRHTRLAQPVLFMVEYALARQWMAWGIRPAAMIGHSIGEYVAACLAGVWSLEDALRIVATRGRLMGSAPEGAMLSVALAAERLEELLGDALEVAAVNAPSLSVVAGTEAAVEALRRELDEKGVECRRLHTSHAFHSAMMDPIMEAFREELRGVELAAPEVRFIANPSGDWITAGEATDVDYWVRHLRRPVKFADGVEKLVAEPEAIFLEVGPGRTLSSLVKQQDAWTPRRPVLTSLPHARDTAPADEHLLRTLGRLWLFGAHPDWVGFHAGQQRRRVSLPTYPFERRSYWIDPPSLAAGASATGAAAEVPEGEAEAPKETAAADPREARPALSTLYVAPNTELERQLAEIWQDLLGVDQVGARDDFFELGGHSLMATQVLSRVRELLDVRMSLRQLMEMPTVAELAAGIEAAGGRQAQRPELPPLRPVSRGAELPLSFSQERLWILDQIEPGSPAYNISFALGLEGALDLAALARSFTEIRRRHESLRTVFGVVSDRPVQRFLPHRDLELPEVDLRGLASGRRTATLKRLVVEDALEPFQLSVGPLFRARLLRLTSSESVLLVSFHHIISDAWSFGNVAFELSQLYTACLREQPAVLPELRVQYADFAHWQHQWLRGEVLEQQVAYWREQLSNLPPELDLPGDRAASGGETSFRGDLCPVTFSRELTDAVVEMGRQHRATLFMSLLAAWNALLYFYSRQEDVLVGSPIAGRGHQLVEPLVGFFVNTLVLRTDLSGDPTFEDLLARVRRTTLDAYAHQDLPFERLVSALGLDRDVHRTPLFRVLFVLQNAPAEALRLPGVEVTEVKPDAVAVRHDLKLDLSESDMGLNGYLEFRTNFFETAKIEEIADLLERVLVEVTRKPALRLSELAEALDERTRERQAAEKRKLRSDTLTRLKRRRGTVAM